MLKVLKISNFILIEEIEIHFESGFNVITGETGAGKSILMGALSLILGERADYKSIKGKAVIEAEYLVDDSEKQWFETNDLDFYPNCIIRRELTENGRSRAFINDSPVALTTLKTFSEQHIDIHGQFQNAILNSATQQLNMIDDFGQIKNLKSDYQKSFFTWKKVGAEIEKLTHKIQ